ncbi:MAG TPA: hypothetical protein PK299_01435 [Anaerolineales bacterium]|nr:hypothetical protein [Anaerolineales bacterium]
MSAEQTPIWFRLAEYAVELISPLNSQTVELAGFFPAPPPACPITVRYQLHETTPQRYELRRTTPGYWQNLTWDDVLTVWIQFGLRDLLALVKQQPVLHTAAVSCKKGGVLLCGESGSGKSTLAAYLALQGWHYLTDEAVLIDALQYNCHALIRPLVLKAGSAQLYQQWFADNPALHRPLQDGTIWLSHHCFPSVAETTTPRIALFPTFRAGYAFQVQALSAAESAFRLLASCFNADALPASVMGSFLLWAGSIQYYQVFYSDVSQVAEWLGETVANLSELAK